MSESSKSAKRATRLTQDDIDTAVETIVDDTIALSVIAVALAGIRYDLTLIREHLVGPR